jgi:amino acid adenylation domain-containing protein
MTSALDATIAAPDAGPAATVVPPDRRGRPEWNGSAIAAFREVVARHPDREAVIGVDGRLTYAELDDRTDRLAGLLTARGAGPERAVGVLLPRSVDLIVAIVAILKAGAVYVPFDPEQPAQRLARMARNAQLVTTVTHADLLTTVPLRDAAEPVVLDRITFADLPRTEPVALHPDNLAYVIFTSGSTGLPKGVEISHRALVSFLNGMEQGGFFPPPGARLAWNASIAFDASVQEWVRVFRGDTVAVLTDDMRRDADEFAEFMVEHRLTEADMTPSHAQMLVDELATVARSGPFLRLYIAGEAVPPALWTTLQGLVADGVLEAMNLYGPTEAAVNVAGTQVRPGEPATIGRPLAGVEARIVDAWLTPVPAGVPGELCVAGPYLARGYSGRSGLTAQRFVPDPCSPHGARMYRTGDRVVQAPDGTIEYLGRTDDQIKIRGHRVELGEIEAVLADHPAVARAVVVHQADPADPTGGRLCAIVRLRPGGQVTDVAAYAGRELPTWMQPNGYTVVDAIPLTVGGKADRVALLNRLRSGQGGPDRTESEPEQAAELPAEQERQTP